MRQQTRNIVRSFLYGLTGAGLFRRLTYPGAPRYAVDPRPVDEIIATTGLWKLIPKPSQPVSVEAVQVTPRGGNEHAKEATRSHA